MRKSVTVAFPYSIDPSRRVASVTVSGRVHGYDIAAAIETLYADPRWHAGFDIVWDATTICELLFEKQDIPGFVQLQRKHAAAAPRREVIITRRLIDRTMAQIYALMMKAGGHEVRACESNEEAYAWLEK